MKMVSRTPVLKRNLSLPFFFSLGLGLNFSVTEAVANNGSADQLEMMTVIGDQAVKHAEVGGTPAKELPLNIHVINTEEIERIQFVDPDELLDRIPGETQVRNLRIPNGGKGYTVPMVDGIPLENPYEGATQRIDRVNTSDIQRVEVIKGASSAIYPNNAFGGVINVVTRDAPKEVEGKVWVEAGEFNRQRFGINAGGTVENLGYFIDINTRDMDGLREGVQNDRDQFSGKFIYDLSDDTRIITRLEHFKELQVTRGDLTAQQVQDNPKQRGSDNSSEDLEQDTFSIKLEQMLNSGYIDFSMVYREKDTIGLSRFRGPQDENDVGINTKFLYRHDFDRSNLVVGFETYAGKQDTQQYARGDNSLSGTSYQVDKERDITAYFAQYEVDLTDRLGLSLGSRFESIDIDYLSDNGKDDDGSRTFSDNALKFGLTYDLSANNMLWFGASEGFYAADADDVFGDGQAGTENLRLQPEKSLNLEVGLRGQQGSWFYDTSYYHNTIKNYFVVEEIAPDLERTTNAGQVTLNGLESVIEYAPENAGWRAGLTYTYARGKYDSFVSSRGDYTGKELRRIPHHHLNARLAWLPTEKLVVELEGDFYSEYYSDDANSEAGRFKRDERINLRVSYEEGPWRFWVHGLNLTDTLEDRATYSRGKLKFRTVDGRTFYTGVSYQF